MTPVQGLALLLASFLLGGVAIGATVARLAPDASAYVAVGAGVLGFILLVWAIAGSVRKVPS